MALIKDHTVYGTDAKGHRYIKEENRMLLSDECTAKGKQKRNDEKTKDPHSRLNAQDFSYPRKLSRQWEEGDEDARYKLVLIVCDQAIKHAVTERWEIPFAHLLELVDLASYEGCLIQKQNEKETIERLKITQANYTEVYSPIVRIIREKWFDLYSK